MADLGAPEQNPSVVDVREENGTTVIWLSGDLDLTSVKQVRAAINAALGSHPRSVILDASGLEYMDSSGVALMARAAQMAQEVQVRNPTPIVRRLLELTGLGEILQIT
ncbi:MAG: STAS domain-containing protein [Streptosporangiaceae bacterium]